MSEKKTWERTCDGCGKDLSDAGSYPNSTCIEVRAVTIPSSGTFRYAVIQYPVLDHAYHFCGLGCLSAWPDLTKFMERMRAKAGTAPENISASEPGGTGGKSA